MDEYRIQDNSGEIERYDNEGDACAAFDSAPGSLGITSWDGDLVLVKVLAVRA